MDGRHTAVLFDRAENPLKLFRWKLLEEKVNRVNLNVKLLVLDWPNGTKMNAFRIAARQARRCAA